MREVLYISMQNVLLLYMHFYKRYLNEGLVNRGLQRHKRTSVVVVWSAAAQQTWSCQSIVTLKIIENYNLAALFLQYFSVVVNGS